MALEADTRAALAALDHAIAARPHAEGHTFSTATRALCTVRDTMAATQPDGGQAATQRERLAHLNGVISVVLAGHFPIGVVPWAELEKARDWLAGFVAEVAR